MMMIQTDLQTHLMLMISLDNKIKTKPLRGYKNKINQNDETRSL